MHEMQDLPARVTRLESQIVRLRQEIRDEFSATRSGLLGEIAGAVTTLAKAIADTNTQMRTLHEDTLSRIATVGEGRQPRKRRS